MPVLSGWYAVLYLSKRFSVWKFAVLLNSLSCRVCDLLSGNGSLLPLCPFNIYKVTEIADNRWQYVILFSVKCDVYFALCFVSNIHRNMTPTLLMFFYQLQNDNIQTLPVITCSMITLNCHLTGLH